MSLQRFSMITGFVVGTMVLLVGAHAFWFRQVAFIPGFSNQLLGGLLMLYGVFRLSRSVVQLRRDRQERRRQALEDRYSNQQSTNSNP